MSIEWSSRVAHPIESVFSWHERPGAFQRLAPPWQGARIIHELAKLRPAAFPFRRPTLEACLRHQLGRDLEADDAGTSDAFRRGTDVE